MSDHPTLKAAIDSVSALMHEGIKRGHVPSAEVQITTAVVTAFRERAQHFSQYLSPEAQLFTTIFNSWADEIENSH